MKKLPSPRDFIRPVEEEETDYRKQILKHLRKRESKLPCSCQYEGLTIKDIRWVGDGTIVVSTEEGQPIMFTTDQNAMLEGPSGDTIEVITSDEFDFVNWDYREPEDTCIGYYGPMLKFLSKKSECLEIDTAYKVIVRLARFNEDDQTLEYIGLTIVAYEALKRGEKPCPGKEIKEEEIGLSIGRDGGVSLKVPLEMSESAKEAMQDLPEPGELP
jgi:hypothetical protein